MNALQLQLGQSSMAFTMHGDAALADFHKVLGHGMDAVGFTEVRTFHPELREACHNRNYQLVIPPDGDTAIAVLFVHNIIGRDYLPVNPGSARPASEGGHGPRGVQVVEFRPRGTRERVTFAEAHWLTRRSDNGGQRLAMTEAMAQVMRKAGKGTRLGFWAGDTNNPDRPAATSDVDLALRKGELTSCWDELGRYPDTHGRTTIDVVGSYDPDSRVSCTRAKVYPQLHSDHLPLAAFYSVRPRKRHS